MINFNLQLLICAAVISVPTANSYAGGSLSLKDAVGEALSNSPRVQKAESEVHEAQWKHRESYTTVLPHVSGAVNYLLQKQYVYTDITLGSSPTPVSIPGIVPTTIYSLDAKWGLFNGGSTWNHIKGTSEFESAAESTYSWTKLDVEMQTTLQYYRAIGALLLKDVAEQNLKTIEDHYKDVGNFKRVGASTNYDVLRVEVQLSEAQSEVMNASDNVVVNRSKLSEITGRESDDRELHGTLPVLDINIAQSVKDGDVSSRADLEASGHRVAGFEREHAAASVYWVPHLFLYGSYQYYNNRNDNYSDFGNFRNAYTLGLGLSWNIFDGLTSMSQSRVSGEQSYQAEKLHRQSHLKAVQDLSFWKRKFGYFCSVYKARVNDVTKATEFVRLAKEGRRAGSRTNTELLDAEAELFKARAGAVNAQLGAVEALINLQLNLGQKLYDFAGRAE